MNDDPADYPFTFACRRSGNCCARPGGVVAVTPDEVVAIAALLGMSLDGFRARYVAPSGDRLKDGFDSRCVFLVDGAEAGCSIYAARPSKCRSWPYWPELLESADELAEAQRLCPGIRMREG